MIFIIIIIICTTLFIIKYKSLSEYNEHCHYIKTKFQAIPIYNSQGIIIYYQVDHESDLCNVVITKLIYDCKYYLVKENKHGYYYDHNINIFEIIIINDNSSDFYNLINNQLI